MGFFDQLFERRGHEGETDDLGTSARPSPVWAHILGGTTTASGITINENTAQNVPVIYACIRRLAMDVGQLPLKLFRIRPGASGDRSGDRLPDTGHPLYSVLHDLANPELSAYDFRDCLQSYLAIWGHAFAEVERNARQEVVALWPLDPARMLVDRDSLSRLRYTYRLAIGGSKTWIWNPDLPPILHLRYDNGRSPIRRMRETIGWAKATEEFGATFFGNNAIPGILLTHPGRLKDTAKQSLRDSFTEKFLGRKRHSVAVLEEGIKVEKLTIPPDDAQFILTMRFTVEQLARIYLMPLHKIGHLDKMSFNNVEQMAIDYVTGTLMPWLVSWEQAIKRDLMGPRMFNTHQVRFIVNGLLRGDFLTRMNGYRTAINTGIMSPNEARALEDLNRRQDRLGDAYWMPMNMQATSAPPIATEPDEPAAPSLVADEPGDVM